MNNVALPIPIIFRRISSGSSSTVDTAKMHVKNIVLTQWKLINGLKLYFSKFTSDRTFENALNKEFAQFLQKIDSKTYGQDLIRYFTSDKDGKDGKKADDGKSNPEDNAQNQNKLSLPNVFSTFTISMKSKEVKKDNAPSWKVTPKPIVTKVPIILNNTILALLLD